MATFEQFRNIFPEDSQGKGRDFEIFLCEWFFVRLLLFMQNLLDRQASREGFGSSPTCQLRQGGTMMRLNSTTKGETYGQGQNQNSKSRRSNI